MSVYRTSGPLVGKNDSFSLQFVKHIYEHFELFKSVFAKISKNKRHTELATEFVTPSKHPFQP